MVFTNEVLQWLIERKKKKYACAAHLVSPWFGLLVVVLILCTARTIRMQTLSSSRPCGHPQWRVCVAPLFVILNTCCDGLQIFSLPALPALLFGETIHVYQCLICVFIRDKACPGPKRIFFLICIHQFKKVHKIQSLISESGVQN